MSKQLSNCSQKKKYRQKAKLSSVANHFEAQFQQNKNYLIQRQRYEAPNSKEIKVKIIRKSAGQKGRLQKAQQKGQSQWNQSAKTGGVCMKTELKSRFSKNDTRKQTNGDQHRIFLQGNQKHDKKVQGFHHLQSQVQEKGSSKESNKLQKQQQMDRQYQKNHYQLEAKKKKRDYIEVIGAFPVKFLNLDDQISQVQEQGVTFQQKQNQNSRYKSFQKEGYKEQIDVPWVYQRALECQKGKFEQCNKNTNYNTNQSKNSNVHNNYHANSKIQQTFRGKMTTSYFQTEIAALIKIQQLQLEALQSANKNTNILKAQKQTNQCGELLVQKRPQRSEEKGKYFQRSEKANNAGVEVINDVELDQQQYLKPIQAVKNRERSGSETKNNAFNFKVFLKSMLLKREQLQREKERKFQKSKYFVQPIPKISVKQKEKVENEEQAMMRFRLSHIQRNLVFQGRQPQL